MPLNDVDEIVPELLIPPVKVETKPSSIPVLKLAILPELTTLPAKLLFGPKFVNSPGELAEVTRTLTGPLGEAITPFQFVALELPPWKVTSLSRATLPTNTVGLELLNAVVPNVLVPVPWLATVMLFGIAGPPPKVASRAVLLEPVLASLRVTGPLPSAL